MTLKEFQFTSNNNFVAYQPHSVVFKRVYLVLIAKNYLIGLVCNKHLQLESSNNLFAIGKIGLPDLVINSGEPSNPYSYLSSKFIRKVESKYLFDQSIFSVEKANFRIDRNDIKSVVHEAAKANTGNYPNDGTIILEAARHDKKELIVLGNQSGKDIVNWILTR